jgi:hypothetical protein
MTYGYENTQEIDWAIINGISSLGVFSHFIHPDDVADPFRNNHKNWDQMYQEYDALHRGVYQNYPWLRSMKVSAAGLSLRQYLQTEVFIRRSEHSLEVQCNRFSAPIYFVLRTSKKVKVPEDCSIRKIDRGIYLIVLKKSSCLITLSR